MRKINATTRCLSGLAWLIFLTGFNTSAQLQSPKLQDTQEILKVSQELVVLHATVENSKGNLIAGLTKENFQVYEDGVLQPIETFSHEDVPVTVGLVIDNSGSMRAKRLEVITAALAFARSSNPQDQIFVVHFNEHVTFGLAADIPFTNKESQLETALAKIVANGMTALYDATTIAIEHARQGNQGKQVLIVISDGADNASKNKLEAVIAQARKSEAIIYTIGLFEPEAPDKNPGVLKKMAATTGGEAFLPESTIAVLPICERIARDIRNQYTITYAPTNANYDGNYRAIKVKARQAGSESLTVRTRPGYFATLKP